MKKYTALQSGTFSAIAVNRKLMALWAVIEELREEIAEFKSSTSSTQSEPVIQDVEAEPSDSAIIEEVTESCEDVFDWRTTEDAAKLKQFALDEFGVEIKGNKKAETIRAEINEHIKITEV